MNIKPILTSFVLMLAIALSATALAVPLYSEAPLSLEAVEVDGGEAVTLEAAELHLLGPGEEDTYIVYADGRYYQVAAESLTGVLAQVGEEVVEALPALGDLQTMVRKDTGDEVTAFQTSLVELGYLDGSADGYYGGQSQRAVIALQQALGLEETGEADPMLQMLVQSLQAEPVTLSAEAASSGAEVVPEFPYSEISGRTDANLDAAQDLGLTLVYDDVTGVGMLTAGEPVVYAVQAETDLDRREFTLNFGLGVQPDEDGLVAVTPVLDLTSVGVQRPVLRQVIIKSGDERVHLVPERLEDTQSGLQAVESARLSLDAEATEMLANAADVGELKLRLVCKYGEYDIPLTEDEIEAIARVGQAGLGLGD